MAAGYKLLSVLTVLADEVPALVVKLVALTRYLIVVQGAKTMSSWSMPIMLAPLGLNTPMILKVTLFRRISLPMGDSPSKSCFFKVAPIRHTRFQFRTSASVKMSPSVRSSQSRTAKNSGVVP